MSGGSQFKVSLSYIKINKEILCLLWQKSIGGWSYYSIRPANVEEKTSFGECLTELQGQPQVMDPDADPSSET